MSNLTSAQITELYEGFRAPIATLDCGKKCAPYNGGAPFCCDTLHTAPTYENLFTHLPQERGNFANYSAEMRRKFQMRHRAISILHRNGNTYTINPDDERVRCVPVARFSIFR